ncbi:MAG: dUTP diphosphatase [Candidatus Brocadiae bacterium]|nr:dUTP diphosphatase [Candidatus Brocadiia bacterium]
MKVYIKRIDKSLPLPVYYTEGSVGFDLYSRLDILIPPKSLYRIPTNLVIEVNLGYMLFIKDRSSTANKGLFATAGIVDQDFCGPEDEILFQVYNFKDEPVIISRGERIAQGVFVQIAKASWQEDEMLSKKNRGGFGSTGDADFK